MALKNWKLSTELITFLDILARIIRIAHPVNYSYLPPCHWDIFQHLVRSLVYYSEVFVEIIRLLCLASWRASQTSRLPFCNELILDSIKSYARFIVHGLSPLLPIHATFRALSQITVLGLTGCTCGIQVAVPGMGFRGQNIRIKYIPCVGTHLWITMPAKSTLLILYQIYLHE